MERVEEKKKAMTELERKTEGGREGEMEGGGGCGRLSRTGTAQISHPSGAKRGQAAGQ